MCRPPRRQRVPLPAPVGEVVRHVGQVVRAELSEQLCVARLHQPTSARRRAHSESRPAPDGAFPRRGSRCHGARDVAADWRASGGAGPVGGGQGARYGGRYRPRPRRPPGQSAGLGPRTRIPRDRLPAARRPLRCVRPDDAHQPGEAATVLTNHYKKARHVPVTSPDATPSRPSGIPDGGNQGWTARRRGSTLSGHAPLRGVSFGKWQRGRAGAVEGGTARGCPPMIRKDTPCPSDSGCARP
jgi:hypothetical protein